MVDVKTSKGLHMNKYRVSCNQKISTTKPGEMSGYRLIPINIKVKAKSYKEARDKLRYLYGYDIIDLTIEECKKTWLSKLLKK